MELKIKIIKQTTCYTTLLVGDKKHTVPTRELDKWVEYFKGELE